MTILFFIPLALSPASAKDLSSRLGLGYRNAFPFSLSAIALQFYPSSDFGLLGAIGVDTLDNNSAFGVQFGVRKIVFKEEHLNFFMGGTASLLTKEQNAVKSSGYELAAVGGCEFFFAGLENLGFNFETGMAVTSLDKVRFRTLGDSFIRSGIIFYF
ncbi:MAG: organic solvent tolerance protein [Bdellovibrio sp.]|nr:MAG: organic solvent tolerance protein [Bdellovibrio sp.]